MASSDVEIVKPSVVKFRPPPLQVRGESYSAAMAAEPSSSNAPEGLPGLTRDRDSKDDSIKTPTTPGPLQTARSDRDSQQYDTMPGKTKQKIGHRRVNEAGQVTYKKMPTSQITGSIQLAIANSVGSLAQKPERDLLMQDFTVVESVYFPGEGGEKTPSHPYSDFRFKTYAPIAFRYFRELFGIQPEDYLSSLCNWPLIELSNPGASGSIFYMTSDDQFVMKTIQHKEADFLQKLMPGYYMNLNQNPRTLLPKFFGLYCYQVLSKNIRLLAMNNLLPSTIKMHQKYDLKGSTYKRRASKHEREKSAPTLKDLDFIEDNPDGIYLEAPHYDALMKTISRDCLVLESFKIMDYSLLMGIHNMDQAAREREAEREQTYLPPQMPALDSQEFGSTSGRKTDYSQRHVMRGKIFNSAMESIQAEALPVDLSDDYPTGGIPARNAKGERLLLFLGIIDILQSYRLLKKLEHTWKSVLHDGDTVSVHRPSFYAQRFQDFMRKCVFKKTVCLDLPEVRGPHHKFRSLVASFLALKHSPSRKKNKEARERRGTTGSDGRQKERTTVLPDAPVSSRPDLVPSTSDERDRPSDASLSPELGSASFPSGGAVRSGSRRRINTDRKVSLSRQEALYDADGATPASYSKVGRKPERLFATSPELVSQNEVSSRKTLANGGEIQDDGSSEVKIAEMTRL